MCGIFGFISDKPSKENYNLLCDILTLSAQRGTDATGLAIRKNKGIRIVKEAIDSAKFGEKYMKDLSKDISESNMVIGHTRSATMGSPKDNNNNHPVVSDKFVMVHNGMCPSMDRIREYKYMGQVDSEILLSYIETMGIEKGITKLNGSASIAVLTRKEANTLYLWRHSNPCYLAYDPAKKTLFFASTKAILEDGLSNLLTLFSTFQIREVEEDWLVKITADPLKIDIIGDIEPEKHVYTTTVHRGGHYGATSGYGYGEEWWADDYGVHHGKDKDMKSAEKVISKEMVAKTKAAFDALLRLNWDAESKMFSIETTKSYDNKSRYYFDGQSIDYDVSNWKRLKGSLGHMSIDKKLLKMYDHEKKSHFLITVPKAIEQGLIAIDISK